MLSNNAKGDVAELMVAERLIREGRSVALPFGNQKGWDLLVQVDLEIWERWQVKNVHRGLPRHKPGSTHGNLRRGKVYRLMTAAHRKVPGSKRKNISYGKDQCDVLVGVHIETGKMWKLTVEQINGRKTFDLREDTMW